MSSSQSPLCPQPPGRAAVRSRTRRLPCPCFPKPALQTAVQRKRHDLLQSLWSLKDPRSGRLTGDMDPLSGTGPTGWAVSFCFVLFCSALFYYLPSSLWASRRVSLGSRKLRTQSGQWAWGLRGLGLWSTIPAPGCSGSALGVAVWLPAPSRRGSYTAVFDMLAMGSSKLSAGTITHSVSRPVANKRL